MWDWLPSSPPCDTVFTPLLGVGLVSFSALSVGPDM